MTNRPMPSMRNAPPFMKLCHPIDCLANDVNDGAEP